MKVILGKGPNKIYIFYIRLLVIISKIILNLKKIDMVEVMKEDWDYLIILDACRYDYFKKCNNICGVLKRRLSIASCTPDWLKANFTGYYDNIVYISANPYISNIKIHGFRGSDHFYKIVQCWKCFWDEELGTVHPQKVVEYALFIQNTYPNKKMIIHFMQPHTPYIGETNIIPKKKMIKNDNIRKKIIIDMWKKVRRGEININKLKSAYEDNLKLVLKNVKKLVEKLNGKIVITSDHGECLNEWFITSHSCSLYIKPLIEIPWLIIEKK